VTAREAAETQKVQNGAHPRRASPHQGRGRDPHQRAEQAPQIEVAQKNRERVAASRPSASRKDKNLEAISREREVELQRIGKEKALETERKAIADVISTRIAVDKKVATEKS